MTRRSERLTLQPVPEVREIETADDRENYERLVAGSSYAMLQHTLEWRELAMLTPKDEPHYFILQDQNEITAALPTVLRRTCIGNAMTSLSLPAGYGGVIVSEKLNHAEKVAAYRTLLNAAVEVARANDCVALSICTPPFRQAVELYEPLAPEYQTENFFQYTALRSPAFHKSTRWDMNKAAKAGVEIQSVTAMDEVLKLYGLYVDRMRIVGGGAVLSRQLVENLFRCLQQKHIECRIAYYQGQPAAGLILLRYNKVCDYYLAALNHELRNTCAMTYLVGRTLADYEAAGFEYWNWQSTPSRRSGTYAFKSKWGTAESKHYYLTKIITKAAFAELKLEEVKQEFQWFYVAPYTAFRGGEAHATKNKYSFANREADFPSMVLVETANVCNLKCPHCPVSYSEIKHTPSFMDLELYKKVCDEVAANQSYLRITGDGEPLLHPQAAAMIRYACATRLPLLSMNTNGVCLEGEVLEAILGATETKVIIDVSLDAIFKSSYQKIRLGSDYERVMRNVFELLSQRKRLRRKNIFVFASIIDQPEAAIELETFRRFWEEILDRVITRSYVDWKGLVSKTKQASNFVKDRWPCLLLYRRVTIGADGQLRFCADDFMRESTVESVAAKTIKEIWQGSKMNKIRERHQTGKFTKVRPCDTCKDWEVLRWDYDYQVAVDAVIRAKQ